MKTFNESMINNYREFNNDGSFEIEGYMVKFNNSTKTLITEYPFAEELRLWWFDIEKEEEKDKKAKFIKDHGFTEVTEVAVAELEKKTTKSAKTTLDRILNGNRIFKKDNIVVVYLNRFCLTKQEKKQLSEIYDCDEVTIAERYFENTEDEREWNKLTYQECMSK